MPPSPCCPIRDLLAQSTGQALCDWNLPKSHLDPDTISPECPRLPLQKSPFMFFSLVALWNLPSQSSLHRAWLPWFMPPAFPLEQLLPCFMLKLYVLQDLGSPGPGKPMPEGCGNPLFRVPRRLSHLTMVASGLFVLSNPYCIFQIVEAGSCRS